MEVTLSDGQHAGADVKTEGGRGFINVDRPRMYNLVDNETVYQGADDSR